MDAIETLGIDVRIIITQVVGFLILYLILNKFLFKRVQGILKKRKKEIKTTYEKNEAERQNVEQLKKEYEKRIEGIKLEAEKATNEGRAIGEKKGEEVVLKAREESNQIIKNAKAGIEQEKEKAFGELKEKMAELSLQVASKVLDKELSPKDHAQFFEKSISEIEELYEK
jgi:F-type H+-transporting ATPase subunit b